MGDYQFTFHEKAKEYNPAWIAPEGIVYVYKPKYNSN